MITFVQYLKKFCGGDEVKPILEKYIEKGVIDGIPNANNIFEVSQRFFKAMDSNEESEEILEALTIAYHRWITHTMTLLGKEVERSIAANRVVIIEEGGPRDDKAAWVTLNQALQELAGSIQELRLASNYALIAQKEMTK